MKKNGIMMIDFAIVATREEGLSAVEAIRKRRWRVPSDHDDDDGGRPAGCR